MDMKYLNKQSDDEKFVFMLTPLEKLALNYALPQTYSFQLAAYDNDIDLNDKNKEMDIQEQPKNTRVSKVPIPKKDTSPQIQASKIQIEQPKQTQTCLITPQNRTLIQHLFTSLKRQIFYYFKRETIQLTNLKDVIAQYRNVQRSIYQKKNYFTHQLLSSIQFIFKNIYSLIQNNNNKLLASSLPSFLDVLNIIKIQRKLREAASYKNNTKNPQVLPLNNTIINKQGQSLQSLQSLSQQLQKKELQKISLQKIKKNIITKAQLQKLLKEDIIKAQQFQKIQQQQKIKIKLKEHENQQNVIKVLKENSTINTNNNTNDNTNTNNNTNDNTNNNNNNNANNNNNQTDNNNNNHVFTTSEIRKMQYKLIFCNKNKIKQIFDVVSKQKHCRMNLHKLSQEKLRQINKILDTVKDTATKKNN